MMSMVLTTWLSLFGGSIGSSIGSSTIAFAASSDNAAVQNPLMSPEEQEIQQRARKRNYPGGHDEENLKVQPQLPQAVRKMSPAAENAEAGAAGPADD
jgi:hypothetical protein